MTDSNISREDWEDRMIDRLLQEKLGGDEPPDLSQKILAAVATDSFTTPKQQKGKEMRTRKTKWIDRFVTASVTCVITVIIAALVIPSIYGNRLEAIRMQLEMVMLEQQLQESREESQGLPDFSSDIIRREQDESIPEGTNQNPFGGGANDPTPGVTGMGGQADFGAIMDLIVETVEPESWDTWGGPGSISENEGGLSLVIRQTEDVHGTSDPTENTEAAVPTPPNNPGDEFSVPLISAIPYVNAPVPTSSQPNLSDADVRQGATQVPSGGTILLGGVKRLSQGVNYDRQTRHLLDELNLRDDRQRGVLDVLMSVERSHTPLSDEPPLLYPDVEVWQQLSAYRLEHYGSVDLSSTSENDQRILAALDNETSVDADGTPLEDVISDWKNEHGIEIQFDTAALRDFGIDPELEEINRTVSGISFRSTLKLILEEIGLTHMIRNEVLLITTREKANEYLAAQGYPPVDIVPPVVSLGQGPGMGGDQYDRIIDNPFHATIDAPLSTFSIDVDTAAYANVRRFLLAENRLPHPDAVRIEEMINYFDYDYEGPDGDVPFASHIEAVACPWNPDHRLVRIALKGNEIDVRERPDSNLVFLLDVSGSMSSEDKLPLLKAGMKLLARQLGKTDRVAIVVYAGSEGLVLESTSGKKRNVIIEALDRLESGGSTNGGAGIELAYDIAQENFIEEGVNRVILCTDGDFNVGTTDNAALERMVEERAQSGVFLSVLGFGRGNLNDSMMENISNKGNGNYAYIDSIREAQKVLVEQMGATLVTIAKDVKIQIEFNPRQVAGYRLIGYANRLLAPEDFNDDTKDAGEIGAGHTVTALYEIVPAGEIVETPPVDPLKYQIPTALSAADESFAEEMLTLKIRYKLPDGDVSTKLEFPLIDEGAGFAQASSDLKFASAVAAFGMLLRDSHYKGDATYEAVLEIGTEGLGDDSHEYRAEFLEMVRAAIELTPVAEETIEEEPSSAMW